jgi:hypothetical protein
VLHVNGEGSAAPSAADPTSSFARGWLAYRQWRRSRPYWGGYFLLLSGLAYYLSAHLDLLPLKVAFGYQGFLSWLIPLIMLLCGLLTWLTPAQRLFYGIIGSVTAVAGLIAVNLGGFFLGMLFGIIGGALVVSWAPNAPAPAPPVTEPPTEPEDVESTDVLPTGPLADQFPTSPTSPLGVPPVQGPRHAAGRDDPPGARLLSLVLIVAAVAAALLALPQPDPAAAAPCKPSSPGTAPKPPVPAPAPPSASPSASPTPSPTGTTGATNPLAQFFGAIGRLIGGDKAAPDKAAPAAAPAAAPKAAATPSPSKSSVTAPKPTSTCAPSSPAKPPAARSLAVPPGQPLVNKVPSKQITAKLSQIGLTFDGVVDLPITGGGTIRVLQFSIASSSSTPFELQVPGPAGIFSIKSSRLTVSGHVRLFITRLQGKIDLLGIPTLPVDFTPESPPPITPPIVTFDDAVVQLVFVHCDTLTAPQLHMSFI